MTLARWVYPMVFFVLGLGVGVLRSPVGGPSQIPEERQDTHHSRAVSDAQFEKRMAKVGKEFGEEMEDFARQFKDMAIQIKKYPIDAQASPDGRFAIRLFGSDETTASDLRQVGMAGVKELVRHYSFSCGDVVYSCDFARRIEDSKMTNVVFSVYVKGEPKFSYVDRNADGLWDRFTDYTQEPAVTYVRDGLCWKRITKDIPKEPDPVP